VKVLGLVSLLNDLSSEMIYPLLPAFVTTTLGASPGFLGAVEGAAEALAAVLKIAAGWISDTFRRRKPIVFFGYGLAALARPLVALAQAPWHVLAVRLADRFGKGTRSAPRDALIAEATPAEQRGRAFGFHRAMDHSGAMVGPLLASAILLVRNDLRFAFALAAVPGVLSLLALGFGIREERKAVPRPPAAAGPQAPLTPVFLRYLVVLAIFTLGNSSDAFLLLKAQQVGISIPLVPLLWSFHHLVKAAASTRGGALSDRLGRKSAILLGWLVYALAYAGFALARRALHVWLLFAVYALYFALSEGAERALVADLSAAARGRAFGLYYAVTGAMLLPASLLTGWLWQRYSPAVALGLGAALATAAALGLVILVPTAKR
jgi:MFS family permease